MLQMLRVCYRYAAGVLQVLQGITGVTARLGMRSGNMFYPGSTVHALLVDALLRESMRHKTAAQLAWLIDVCTTVTVTLEPKSAPR